jgi:hypothetical protein
VRAKIRQNKKAQKKKKERKNTEKVSSFPVFFQGQKIETKAPMRVFEEGTSKPLILNSPQILDYLGSS